LAPLVQVQAQGVLLPSPLTAEAVAPAVHSVPARGVTLVVVPLAAPHRVGGGGGPLPPGFGAAQLAVPALVAQVQIHAPLPLNAEAVPMSHRSAAAGAVPVATPLAAPHWPGSGTGLE
jgi:hypothetical protein